MDEAEFNKFILTNMPYFIAINYQRLLETQEPQERVRLILHIYNLELRTLTINLVSQYLIHDRDTVNDPFVNEILKKEFPELTLDVCQRIFFALLRAYHGKSNRFFMPELYELYWDTSTTHHRPRLDMEHIFERLTQFVLGIESGHLLPQDQLEWSQLEHELMGLLKNILEAFSFFEKYDLIRILNFDKTGYDFELHRGIHISSGHQRLSGSMHLKKGYFYLRSKAEEFLWLYPLIVFWDKGPEEYQSLLPDIAVYDRVLYDEQLQYLMSKSRRKVVDDSDRTIRDFAKLLHATLEVIKSQYQEPEKLTWWQLRDLCEKITFRRAATVREKYHKDLYLQRDKTRQEFEKFLQSEKSGFVLIGKSGVGKSNFLLSLLEELHQSRTDISILMYDGANLDIEKSVTGIIKQDFENLLISAGQQIKDLWRSIAMIDGIEDRLVLLCIDSINENPQATELLMQLDELVQAPWPWLKIVFSSRPETWQAIKQGLKLSQALYYEEQRAGKISVGLEPFIYSQLMEPFSRQELSLVYAKYQRAFDLQTQYETLSTSLREMLREPLNLWLIASTYRGETVPSNLKVTELVEKYVEELLKTNRLQREDLRLLEKELIPIMLNKQHYNNEITAADIDAVGDRLYLLINSKQELSNGQRINQSFINLLDIDILVRQKLGHDQRIAFKFERFYEYFIGEALAQLSNTQIDRYAFFQGLIEETARTAFLWGAVRNALVEDLKKRGPAVLLQLCFTDHQRVKEMVVSVLIYFGLEEREQVEDVLKSLVPHEKKLNLLQKIQQVLGKADGAFNIRTRNARKIAVEVASNLNISWVLQTSAQQMDPTIRTVAVRYTYHLWQRDRKMGFEILEYLAVNATSSLIPNFNAFESTLGLSAIIFFEHFRDETVLRRLQSIWHGIIAKVLSIREGNHPWLGAFREFMRERLLAFVIAIAFRFFRELPEYNIINYQGLEAFFQLGTAEKNLYQRIIHYLNIPGSYSKEQMESDYLQVIKINNLLLVVVAFMGLIAQTCSAPLSFLPFLKRLFEEAKKDIVTYPYLTNITDVVVGMLDLYPMNDEIFDFFVYAAEICQKYYAQYPQTLRNPSSKAPEATYLSCYIINQYRRAGTVKTAWLETRIEGALSQNNILFFDLLIKTELPVVGIELHMPRAALDVLELFFSRSNEEIRKMIQSFLARLRIHHPNEVDDFLEAQNVSDDFRLHVRTNEPIETIGELIGLRSWLFLRDDVLLGTPELRSLLMRVFEKAADCKNLRIWVDYFFRELINLIYGGEALRQSK